MKNVVTFVSGIVAGAALGLLLAPASGSETRKRIRDEADKLVKDATDSIKDTIKRK